MSNITVEVVDVGLRDGLQNDPAMMNTEGKLEFINRLLDAGVRRMEVASFVNPKRVPQMADSDDLMARVPRGHDIKYIGLALNDRGMERAIEAKCEEVNFVVVASDTFGLKNQTQLPKNPWPCSNRWSAWRKTPRPRARPRLVPLLAVLSKVKYRLTMWCRLPRDVPNWRHGDCLADTIGVADPWEVKRRVSAVKKVIGDLPLRCHFHNTRNTGIANAFAAIEAGVHILDASCGGIGGCPFAPKATGNIATEDLLYMLERAGISTGVDVQKIIDTAHWLEGALDHAIPAMVSKAGLFPTGAAAQAAE